MEVPGIRSRNSWLTSAQCGGRRYMRPAIAAGAGSQQITQRGSCQQQYLASLGDYGPRLQHVVVLALDGAENGEPAATEQLDVARQPTVHHFRQRQPLVKPLPRAIHLKLHHGQKPGRRMTIRQVLLAHAKLREIFQGKVDPSLFEVCAYVLPEVCQLQCCACVVGKLLPLRITITTEIQYEVSHRIRRILTIS